MTDEDAYHIDSRKTFLETKSEIEREFRLWKVNEFRIVRETPGAAVEWYPLGSDRLRILRSADQDTPGNNLRKLYLIIRALRLNEARGFAEYMRDFYAQLPAGAGDRNPYEVLGVLASASLDDIEAMYRAKAKRLHPDAGGANLEAMKQLNAAMDRIRTEKGGLSK
jgi:DnaJ-domain-containing protein 1